MSPTDDCPFGINVDDRVRVAWDDKSVTGYVTWTDEGLVTRVSGEALAQIGLTEQEAEHAGLDERHFELRSSLEGGEWSDPKVVLSIEVADDLSVRYAEWHTVDEIEVIESERD